MNKDFLSLFHDSWIQTLDDNKKRDPKIPSLEMPMADYDKRLKELQVKNNMGCGIFFTPNSCSGGRKRTNLTAINWVYCDIDSGTKDEQMARIDKCPLDPDIIVESKNGYHLYWRCAVPFAEGDYKFFAQIESGIIQYFDADKQATDPTRLLRLPGFNHCKIDDKNPKYDPFEIRVVALNYALRVYVPEEIMAKYPVRNVPAPAPIIAPIADGEIETLKKIPFTDVLNKLGIQYRNNSQIHWNGEWSSWMFDLKTNLSNRFSGQPGTGSVIDLVMTAKNLDLAQAIRWIKDEWHIKEQVFERESSRSVADEIDWRSITLSWGTQKLDEGIQAIEKNHYVIFAGATNQGKTAFMFDMAVKNALLGNHVMFLTLEQTKKDLLTTIGAKSINMTRVQWKNRGDLPQYKKDIVTKRIKEIENIKNLRVAHCIANQREICDLIKKYKPDLTIIDNFDLIRPSRIADELEMQKMATEYFIDFTNTNNLPIVCVHHLRKSKAGDLSGLMAIRGSGKITDGADIVVLGQRAPFDEHSSHEQRSEFVLSELKSRGFGYSGNVVTTYFDRGTFLDSYNPPSHNPEQLF